MLTGIHFLLTYTCLYECDHCFVHGSPNARGTFTQEQVRMILDEIRKIRSIEEVHFEGGEPFLHYPLLIESVRLARAQGLRVGIVTNGYWANCVEDAKLWLEPLRALGVSDLSISDDAFHQSTEEDTPPKRAHRAARELGIPSDTISIAEPAPACNAGGMGKGKPVVGGPVRFRGRAAEKLTGGLPTLPRSEFTECRHEELEDPERVHVDAFGNVHICQGLLMGNLWRTPLSEMVCNYRADGHPICGPLLEGGPALLAATYAAPAAEGYVDECHCCYSVRKSLLGQFPDHLGPRQVYGVADGRGGN